MPTKTLLSVTSVIKTTWYLWSTLLFSYLNIEWTQVLILTVLMIIDFIFWVIRQYTVNKKEITSHKAWLWVFKKWSTLMLILSIALVFKWIDLDWSDYIQWMLWIFIMAEGYSICRSVYTIRTGETLPEYDVISLIIRKMWDFIISLINKKKNSIFITK